MAATKEQKNVNITPDPPNGIIIEDLGNGKVAHIPSIGALIAYFKEEGAPDPEARIDYIIEGLPPGTFSEGCDTASISALLKEKIARRGVLSDAEVSAYCGYFVGCKASEIFKALDREPSIIVKKNGIFGLGHRTYYAKGFTVSLP